MESEKGGNAERVTMTIVTVDGAIDGIMGIGSGIDPDVQSGNGSGNTVNHFGDEVSLEASIACCFACANEISSGNVSNEEEPLAEESGITLLTFCTLLKIAIPSTAKSLFQTYYTPLCDECFEMVNAVKSLLGKVEELEKSIDEKRSTIKGKVCSGEHKANKLVMPCQDGKTFRQFLRVVDGIRSSIKKDLDAEVVVRRSNHEKKHILMDDIEGKTYQPASPSSVSQVKSSFGRTVKRPRYLSMSDEDTRKSEEQSKVNKNSACSLSPIEVSDVANPDSIQQTNFDGSFSGETYMEFSSIMLVPNEMKCEAFNCDTEDCQPSPADGEINFSDSDLREAAQPQPQQKKERQNRKRREKNKSGSIKSAETAKPVKSDGQTGVQKGDNLPVKCKKLSSKPSVNIKLPKNLKLETTLKINCNECTETFIDETELARHIARMHTPTTITDHFCVTCNARFTTRKELVSHKRAEHPVKRIRIRPKDPDGEERRFVCEFCDFAFKNHGDLLIHRRRHTGERPFKCETCNEGFVSKGRYEVHCEGAHPDLPPLKCEYCPRSFFRHHRLRDHLISHTKERPYLCEICSKSFSQPAYLKYHQTTHKELNLEEFKCNECDKTFASPVNLKYHTETQHQKKYRFYCKVCGHGATHMSHMKLHMRSHTGERPHSCPHCGKSFTRGSQLKIHIRSHTGERPYVCETCGKAFTNSSKLRRHENIHTSNKPAKLGDSPQEIASSSQTALNAESTSAPNVQYGFGGEGEALHVLAFKEEAFRDPLGDAGNPEQPHVYTIHQPDGVTYQMITRTQPDENIIGQFVDAEFIVINDNFTIS